MSPAFARVTITAILIAATPLSSRCFSAPANPLPIHIEDNHGGSFHFFAANLSLHEEYTLVLFDAHSDASAAPHSDEIRSAIRRVRSDAERQKVLDEWRRSGRIQPFDWIEPLMPKPISQVVWVYADEATDAEIRKKSELVHRQLDGRLEAEKRDSGQLADRFSISDLRRLNEELPKDRPIVVSIDLDYFAGVPTDELEEKFRTVLDAALTLPDLQALTFAVSRPWLNGDEEAHQLVLTTLKEVLAIENVAIRFEPFVPQGPDRSEMAKSYYRQGKTPPGYDLATAPGKLNDLLLNSSDRLKVTYDTDRWNLVLDAIRLERGELRIAPDDVQVSADGIWRIPENGRLPPLRAHANLPVSITSIRWLRLVPERDTYNVLPDLPAGKTFAGTAPPLIRYREIEIATTQENALPSRTWSPLLSGQYGLGSIRFCAEITTGSGEFRTPPIELRVFRGNGLRAGISEQFGLPYVFGAGFLRSGSTTGPEAGGGNDCANFFAYACRRAGVYMPWVNPAQMRKFLNPIASSMTVDDRTPVPANAANSGTFIHFGSHVGALWEDLEPVGSLGKEDMIVHHLSGPPEIVPLGKLLNSRPRPYYDVLTFPEKNTAATITIAGDINLSSVSKSAPNPLEGHSEILSTSDLTIANLECAVTDQSVKRNRKPFQFVADPDTLQWVKDAGIDVVTLANNHSADGPVADTLENLARHELASAGMGPDLDSAIRPAIFEVRGIKIAIFSVSLINPDDAPATAGSEGIAVLPSHQQEFRRKLRQTSTAADFILVIPHWGREYTDQVTESQRFWARWFIDQGAHAVAGCHTHHPQHAETYRGRPIFYSLGNLFFPNRGPNLAFSTPAFARLNLDENGELIDYRLLIGKPAKAQKSSPSPPSKTLR